MHKAIAKQLDLDERQTRQLKMALEETSWLYSESTSKRMAAVFGLWFIPYFLFAMIYAAVATFGPDIIYSYTHTGEHYEK